MEKSILFWNPWWDEDFKMDDLLYRKSFGDISNLMGLKEVILLSGVRRSGKTSLLYYLIRGLIDGGVAREDILYLNMDDEILRYSALEEIYGRYLELFAGSGKKYVFLDEIQNIVGWERWIKNKYDSFEKIKFIITGSKSHLLKRESSVLLTGRTVEFELFPLDFEEFLGFKGIKISRKQIVGGSPAIKRAFNEYLEYGGFPEVVLQEDCKLKTLLLKEYYDNIRDRDVIRFFNIREIAKFERLAFFLISNVGKRMSASKMGSFVGLSTSVVNNYLDFSGMVYLFLSLNHFNYSVKKQITADRKIYCADTGLVNSVSFKFSENRGRMLENLVFVFIRKNFPEVYYDKQKNECDFIVRENGNVVSVVQVCYELNDENRNREVSGLSEAMRKFGIDKGLILTYGLEDSFIVEGKEVIVKPVWKWLLEGLD